MDWREFIELLGDDRWVAFATLDGCQPRVRMMTVRARDGKLWTYTSASSAKASQLLRNDRFEFVINMAGEADLSSLRVAGRAEVVSDPTARRRHAEASPSFKEHWSSPDDPDFMLVRLHVETLETERGPDTKAERFVLKDG